MEIREYCPQCGSKKYNIDENETEAGNYKEVLCDNCGYRDTILIMFRKDKEGNYVYPKKNKRRLVASY